MTHYRRVVRVSRLRVLRALFSRRGLVLSLEIDADGDFMATLTGDPPARPCPQWHRPDETWELP